VLGTAGSFFKNPTITRAAYEALVARHPELPGYVQEDGSVKVPLGWILDKLCALRGYRAGTLGCYQGQALVVVNYGGATAAQVRAFAEEIAARVFAVTGITIEWEVTTLPARRV
jgi:UDP-N-acetylmuramate dehydrogenase